MPVFNSPRTAHGRGRPPPPPPPLQFDIPPPGYFDDISLNTLFGARPTGWPTGENAGPFANWSAAVWCPDFGTHGGYAVHGSGHLNAGQPLWAGVWVFDVGTQMIVGRCIPSEPLLEGSSYNGFFESTAPATTGHTYAPHTYDGLVYQSTANGGGPDGSLIRVFHAGATIDNPRCVHRFDLSSLTEPPMRVIDDIPMTGSSSSYPQTALDEARGGFWLLTYSGWGPMTFVSFADWSMTTYPVEYGGYGDQAMVYIPAPYDVLLCLGRTDGGGVSWSYRVAVITDGVPDYFNTITVTGTAPGSAKSGAQWSELLGKVVSYNSGGSYDLFKLTPPSAADVRAKTGTWTWESETLVGVNGATPATRSADDSGTYSRMLEAPSLGCLLLANSINARVQAWRSLEM